MEGDEIKLKHVYKLKDKVYYMLLTYMLVYIFINLEMWVEERAYFGIYFLCKDTDLCVLITQLNVGHGCMYL